ncbi:MAG TPA: GNAT family protein [Alphaproteobacteria bacterium]|nr:GNAT family protein [Alphaproteobacteria bacterium]
MTIEPVTLCGSLVRLEPLTLGHLPALVCVGLEPELWRLQPTHIRSAEDMKVYVEKALEEQRQGASLPFVIVHLASKQVIGSTRYMEIAPAHRRLEIGSTWLTSSHQRTGANTETKLLLLTHAFETLSVIRVVLKTDALNQQSRRAILRIGAVEEGTFRKHLIADSGRVRDMVYFSILDTEWPAVKAKLTAMLRSSGSLL